VNIDVRQSLTAWIVVTFAVIFGAAALLLLRRVDVPRWMPLVAFALGLACLAFSARELVVRRDKKETKHR
jgi:hypothetical protein